MLRRLARNWLVIDRTPMAQITAECCDEPSETCEDGYPTTCNTGCAAVLLPARASCEAGFLASGGPFKAMVNALDEVLRSPDAHATMFDRSHTRRRLFRASSTTPL